MEYTVEEVLGTNVAFSLTVNFGAEMNFDKVQSDWTQADTLSMDYIKNKPDLVNFVATTVTVDEVHLDTTITPADLGSGELAWDSNENTAVFGLPDGGQIQIGKEMFDYYKNVDTVPLVNGDIVSVVSVSGNQKGIKRTDCTNSSLAKNVLGMVTVTSIPVNGTGRITKSGEVHDLATSLYTEGQKIYVQEGNPGKWSSTPPNLPNYIIEIGTVIVSNANVGIIDIKPVCYPKLIDLSDVNGVSSSVNKPIVRKADGVIDAIDTALDIDAVSPSTGTFAITGNVTATASTVTTSNATTVNATLVDATEVQSTNGFKKDGRTDADILLAAGGHKAISDFQLKSEKGQPNGYASLDASGLIPSAQLPAYVDDIIEVANYAALPVTGETGKIYVTLDTNKTYRWSGSAYVYITSGAVDSVAGKTGVVTLVKADVGLSNVDNTSDANKPISTATQTALNGKVNNTGDETIAGVKTFSSSPIVPNPTTSGQAMNKGTADGAYVGLTGNQTVTGVKTFSSSPVVPDGGTTTQAVNANTVASMVTTAQPASQLIYQPELTYHTRVLADAGVVSNAQLTEWLLNNLQNQINDATFAWDGVAGIKTETSGSNLLATKLYNIKGETYDASQATSANKFYFCGNIAPNEKGILKLIGSVLQSAALAASVTKANTSNFSLVIDLKPLNADTTSRRLYFDTSNYIEIKSTSLAVVVGAVTVASCNYAFVNGKSSHVVWTYDNGQNYIYINGVLQTLTASAQAAGNIVFSKIEKQATNTIACHLSAFILAAKLSANDCALNYLAFRTLRAEIEGKDIGNQHWATSNLEATVDGAGNVIGEVQGATNVELITNAADRDFSSDTGYWTKTAGTTISGGTLNINEPSAIGALSKSLLTIGKKYKLQFEIISITSGYITYAGAGSGVATSTTVGIKTYYFTATGTSAGLFVGSNTVATVDNISVQEVGWSEAQLMYDNVYAYTIGTAAVKDLAATKAAAMLAYYNNDVPTGAIYGKLYNWWAVRLFALYPIKGWRVPTSADFTQLQTYLGGSTVAGGKMKALYGGFNNAYSTNESGLSITNAGRRIEDGTFNNSSFNNLWTSSENNSTNGYQYFVEVGTKVSDSGAALKVRGFPIRLLRNAPVGENEKTETSGRFTTDIVATAKQIPISFGYSVRCLRISADTALTSVEAKLYNSAGTAIATLITGKSISAGATMVYNLTAEHEAMLNDGTVRVTASGNAGSTIGMNIDVVLDKTTLS